MRISSLALFVVFACGSPPPVEEPDSGQDSGADAGGPEDLSDVFEPLLSAHPIVGVAGAVVDAEDGVVAIGAAGPRRRGGEERVTVDDRWHLGSDTKAMTATVAAILVEEGAITWERTVVDAFPAFADRIDPAFGEVTLVHLLTHRAGLTANVPGERPEVWARLWEDRRPLPDERLWYAEQLLTAPPAVPPATEFRYTNAGYIVAGAMLEQATGETWEALMRTRLFGPLGMRSCGFGPPATAPASVDAPWGHRDDLEPVAPGPAGDNPPALGPAGTVHCDLRDWGTFVALHLRGAQGDTALLPRAAFARLHAGPGFAPLGDGSEYAYGWLADDRGLLGPVLTHAGSNTMFYAVAWLATERGRAYLAVTNRGGTPADAATDAVISALVERFPPPP